MVTIYVLLGILLIWLFILTLVLIRTRNHYLYLVKRTDKRTVEDILNKLLRDNNVIQKEIEEIKKELNFMKEKSSLYYQKIGFLRFNPFDRIGGDQSFIIALLNKEDSGIIITFLYTRDGMRIYSKLLDKGISKNVELSEEEKEVIKKAR